MTLHQQPVLGIRDILVRIRIWTSDKRIRLRLRIQLWIRLRSSVTLRMPKNFFLISFLITYPQANYLQSKFFIIILQAIYQSAQHLYEKRQGSGPGSIRYLWLMDLDPGGPKTCGSPRLLAVVKHEVWPDVFVVRGADANVLLVDLLADHLGPELRVQHHSQAPCRSHHQPSKKDELVESLCSGTVITYGTG